MNLGTVIPDSQADFVMIGFERSLPSAEPKLLLAGVSLVFGCAVVHVAGEERYREIPLDALLSADYRAAFSEFDVAIIGLLATAHTMRAEFSERAARISSGFRALTGKRLDG